MGLVGWPLVLSFLYSAWERRKGCKAEGKFWLAFVPCCVLVGILVVGERDSLGDAHLTLLSLEAMGLALLAGTLPVRRARWSMAAHAELLLLLGLFAGLVKKLWNCSS